jgi:hypothetical protein
MAATSSHTNQEGHANVPPQALIAERSCHETSPYVEPMPLTSAGFAKFIADETSLDSSARCWRCSGAGGRCAAGSRVRLMSGVGLIAIEIV